MQSSLVDVQYRRGQLEREDGIDVHQLTLFRRVLPTFTVTVEPGLSVPMDDVVQVLLEASDGDCGPITVLAGTSLIDMVDVANTPGPVDLCPAMFPADHMWIIPDMPVMIMSLCDTAGHTHQPEPVHLLHMSWTHTGTVVLDLFNLLSETVHTEAWDSSDDEVGHCPVLDRAGAGRLLAGIGSVLGQHPDEDDELEL